jgi:type VI secretion system protein ImpA
MATSSLLDLDSLLVPITPDAPSGRNLAYELEYDALREARRAEDDTLQGAWQRNAKTAQWDRVLELGTDLIRRRSKDLQVAAWITEALTKLHGFAGLRDGLRLLHMLQQTFWDSCFPEVEDGDLEARQSPYYFLNGAKILPLSIRSIPLTTGFNGQNYSYLRWQESRDTDNTGLKNPDLLATLIAEGKITGEKFDEAVAQTPRSFYEALVADLDECLAAFKELDQGNDDKTRFGRDAPGLGEIRKALEDCRTRLAPILAAKRIQEPDPEAQVETEAATEESSPDQDWSGGGGGAVAEAPVRRPAAAARGTAGPIASVADAERRIRDAAAYLRAHDPGRPVAYLAVRALRAGALYALGQPLDPSQCEAPSRETRQRLRQLAAEGDWSTLLELAEQSVGGPEGSAWLDAERYALTAMASASDADRTAAASACRSLLRALLHDFPDLPQGELNDGTPAANAETRAWIAAEILPPATTPEPSAYSYAPPPVAPSAAPDRDDTTHDATPDVWEQAQALVRGRQVAEALQLVRRAMNTAATGRERFYRKLQLAELCLMVNNHRLALPLSEDLARQVDEFRLEQWEDEGWSARVWAALYRCLRHAGTANGNAERLQQVFTRLCRLDINQALMYANDSPQGG